MIKQRRNVIKWRWDLFSVILKYCFVPILSFLCWVLHLHLTSSNFYFFFNIWQNIRMMSMWKSWTCHHKTFLDVSLCEQSLVFLSEIRQTKKKVKKNIFKSVKICIEIKIKLDLKLKASNKLINSKNLAIFW